MPFAIARTRPAVSPPRVSHGREAAPDGGFGETSHGKGSLHGTQVLEPHEVHGRDHVVDVRIDESGQQKPSARVDHALRADRGRRGIHVDDAISLDRHMAFADDFHARGIESVAFSIVSVIATRAYPTAPGNWTPGILRVAASKSALTKHAGVRGRGALLPHDVLEGRSLGTNGGSSLLAT